MINTKAVEIRAELVLHTLLVYDLIISFLIQTSLKITSQCQVFPYVELHHQ